ncbi:hypothetical protein BDQ17DRAFT_1353427 [Cyathus striatus]|nr:hypothetical protein BDQ17DRAFT_1353427 [Cyathus striatus]
MSRFQPPRSSSPAKRSIQVAESIIHASDLSRSSVVDIPELKGLSPRDVELIDAVIARAGPSASTFLPIFKAYNDVFSEHGLDPHEAVFYGKLLRLGTLKGKNWSEKWQMIKEEYGYTTAPIRDSDLKPTKKAMKGIKSRLPKLSREATGQEARRFHRPASPTNTETTAHSKARVVNSEQFQTGSIPPSISSRRTFHTLISEETDDYSSGQPPSKPPSYKTTVTSSTPNTPLLKSSKATSKRDSAAAAREAVARARQRKGSVVNADDAWKNIELQWREEEADRFRDRVLRDRCWEIWKQGLHWITTTNLQIDDARDGLVMRKFLQRWHAKYKGKKELYTRVSKLVNTRRIRSVVDKWKLKLNERRQIQWRHAMRQKMKTIKDKRELQMKRSAWIKWRQLYQCQLADLYHQKLLEKRFYTRWKIRYSELEEMEAVAEDISRTAENNAVERSWYTWRKLAELQSLGRIVEENVDLRVLSEILNIWKRRMQNINTADNYYDVVQKRNVFSRWKLAMKNLEALNRRSDKYISRQDDLLLRAVIHVWRSRERGRFLEARRSVKVLTNAWSLWRNGVQHNRKNEEIAIAFSNRPDSSPLVTTFQRWQMKRSTHVIAQEYAMQYHASQLGYTMMFHWRVKLRKNMKMEQKAQDYYKLQLFKRWEHRVAEERRKRLLLRLDRSKLERVFQYWSQITAVAKQRRNAENAIRSRIEQRIIAKTLSRWTTRVIELKTRELDVAQMSDMKIQILALRKWQNSCAVHLEERSLMESYLFVKREDMVRRVFHCWLAATRSSRHRNLTLQKREDELKLIAVSSAWEKWRERFIDEKFRLVEYNIIIQCQRNLMFRTFGVWHSKTKSLPAIRFHAIRLKGKFFRKWRNEMPRALQAKEAREKYYQRLLGHCVGKWLHVYRTKKALKAVARARYLRLPTAVPRPHSSSPRFTAPPTSRGANTQREKELDVADDVSSSFGRVECMSASSKFGIAVRPRGLSPRVTRPPVVHSPSKTRDPSPARTAPSYGVRRWHERSPEPPAEGSDNVSLVNDKAKGEDRGRSLWLELREARLKSRASSKYSAT